MREFYSNAARMRNKFHAPHFGFRNSTAIPQPHQNLPVPGQIYIPAMSKAGILHALPKLELQDRREIFERSGDTAFRMRSELPKRQGTSLPASVQDFCWLNCFAPWRLGVEFRP